MATEHHHTGLDDEKFDRYDTFGDLVTGNVDPNRNGLFGEIGRLIDQIRIKNAADKLDDNVAVGEDRALTVTGNWGAVPHEELYASVHTDNNPSEAYALAREWTQLGNMMAENSRVMDATIRSTESGWVGPAAEVARAATLRLATWGGDAAQTSQYMGTRIADQGLAAERAKAAMPEPVNFDYEQMLRQGFATGGLAGLAMAVQDVNTASVQARTAHAQAAQVMSQMEAQSRDVDETTPRFVRPPEVTDGGTGVQGLRGDGLAPLSAPMAATLPSGQQAPAGSTAAAFAGGVPDIPASVAAGGVSSGQASAGTYVPPKISVPDMPGFGTTTAGYSPNVSIPGGHPGGTSFGGPGSRPDLSSYLPPGLSTGRGRDSNTSAGYVPGINPATGQPYTPDEARRGMPSLRGGVPGGGAGASGAAFGSRGGMPGNYVGAVAAAEQAAARGAVSAAMTGQNGTSGAPGMGAPGGMGKSGGDDDKEHRNKYASNEKIIEEPGRMVPSVIGEKSARQLKEEQPG